MSVYGGGRRRSNSGDGGFFAFLIGFALVFVVVVWPLSLIGHAIGLTPSWHQLMNRHDAWMHEHYSMVGLRYVAVGVISLVAVGLASIPFVQAYDRRRAEEARQADLAYQSWLKGPAPQLVVPSRFTDRWFADNVPHLHPGQVDPLRRELRARGWKDDRIQQRVGPYLSMNPHLS